MVILKKNQRYSDWDPAPVVLTVTGLLWAPLRYKASPLTTSAMDSPTTGSWHTWQPKWRERLLNSDLRSKLTLSKAPQRGWKTRAGHSAVSSWTLFWLLRSQVPWLEKQHRSLQGTNYSALHLGVTATLQLLQALRNPKVQIKTSKWEGQQQNHVPESTQPQLPPHHTS